MDKLIGRGEILRCAEKIVIRLKRNIFESMIELQ